MCGMTAKSKDFIFFAAELFGVSPESLSPETSHGSIPEWDSVMHLRLAMETEAHYGVRLPIERLPELNSLGDFMQCIEGDVNVDA